MSIKWYKIHPYKKGYIYNKINYADINQQNGLLFCIGFSILKLKMSHVIIAILFHMERFLGCWHLFCFVLFFVLFLTIFCYLLDLQRTCLYVLFLSHSYHFLWCIDLFSHPVGISCSSLSMILWFT